MVDRLAALQQGDLRLGAGGLKLGQGLFRLSLLDALSVENADKLAPFIEKIPWIIKSILSALLSSKIA